MATKTSPFDTFTNRYSLSKTLRFELKPIGKTLENMRDHLNWDEKLQTFLVDQGIEDAYQTLKPQIDAVHEQFITDSLESEESKKILFSGYLEQYRNKKTLGEDSLKKTESLLRSKIAELYIYTGDKWKKEKYTEFEWKKGSSIASSFLILSSKDVLHLIKKQYSQDENIQKAANIILKGFFTYFGGFNQNRENYYATKDEKATAVATRIVHENLPKFCDNVIFFENQREEYLNMHVFLKQQGNELVTKDGAPLPSITQKIFVIDHFNQCLSQKQIDIYNEEIGNANSLINHYNQAKKNETNFKRLPLFKTLYKQIGCGKQGSLFFEITCNSNGEKKNEKDISLEEVLESVRNAGEKYFRSTADEKTIYNVPKLLNYLRKRENYSGVYWSKVAINTISNKYFANWHELEDRLKEARVFEKHKGSEDDTRIPEAVELEGLFSILDKMENWKEGLFKENILKTQAKKDIIATSDTPRQALLQMIFSDILSYSNQFLSTSSKILGLRQYNNKETKEKIKAWLDDALSVLQMLKYFHIKETKAKGETPDSIISEALDTILLRVDDRDWFDWYDAIRNYLTKKPQDDVKRNKLKLNFENASLLGGWSDGQEKVKASVILKKDESYYLGILRTKSLFNTEKTNNPIYQSITPHAGRLILANLKFQTLAGKGFLGEFGQTYGNMGKEHPIKAIESLQKIIKDRYVKKYPLLKKVIEKSYKSKKDFDKEVQEILADCYVCEFIPLNWQEVDKQTVLGNIYLFKIHSKDDEEKNTGRKNLQTSYWQTVFEEDSPFQLNGGGEIFYRKQAINDKKVKTGYEGKSYVIENKRFTVEKFLFHCPIKLNYKAKNYSKPEYALPEVNKQINEILTKVENIHFLGIDRGEKNLLYYSLINKNGEIIEQGSLNKINEHNYHAKLDELEKNRMEARKSWQTIGTIKELKEGYISQVVKKIADLAIEHNAFIVLEDLNTGFKRGRQKIEKSVYQKFELALAKKLNFFVNKSARAGEIGSVTKALQLTPPVSNYQDIENRRQVGIMLYTRANYTSQTDPITGWRKTIYLKKGSEETIKKQILSSFIDFGFDEKDYYFEYRADNTEKIWKLYSGNNGKPLDRFRGKRGNKNEWNIEQIHIVQMLDKLFTNFDKKRSYRIQITDDNISLTKIDEKYTAWESLRFVIDIIQQIRNTGSEEKNADFILSPVRDKNGHHFDSREDDALVSNGDANGAYNIARKGVIMYEHIKRKCKLFISDSEWDIWLAGKAQWGKWQLDPNNKKLFM
jgi:hypothetical protein